MQREVEERRKTKKVMPSRGTGEESSKPPASRKGKEKEDVVPPPPKRTRVENNKHASLPNTRPIDLDDLEDSSPGRPPKEIRGKNQPKPRLTKDKLRLQSISSPTGSTSFANKPPSEREESEEEEEVPLLQCNRKSTTKSAPTPSRVQLAPAPPRANPALLVTKVPVRSRAFHLISDMYPNFRNCLTWRSQEVTVRDSLTLFIHFGRVG